MRDELAGRLLDALVDWTDEERARWIQDLQRLAALKYDSYEGFVAGERFFESLARWLGQFEQNERRRLLEFVRQELVFISREELSHAISVVYPDFVKPRLIDAVAEELELPPHQVRRIVDSVEFRSLRRKTLYLGLSDGARLDRLRRSNPELSHEQFWLSPELGPNAIDNLVAKLGEAIEKQELVAGATFRQVVLVDDYYGSGTSLLHRKDNEWAGKLLRPHSNLQDLKEKGAVEEDARVMIVLYVASGQAEEHIREALADFEPNWELQVVQRLPENLRVEDAELVELCEWFFDDVLVDEHKKERLPLGYGKVALPLVLHHNTPNNSVCLLWADSVGREEGLNRRALFPRYERHHVDRP